MRVSNFWNNNYIEHERNIDRSKTLSVEEYLNNIRPYLIDINNLKKSDKWKIQLTVPNNFNSFIDNEEERVMNSKSDNLEIKINDEADEFITNLKIDIKIIQNLWKVERLSLIMFIYRIINVIKPESWWIIYIFS